MFAALAPPGTIQMGERNVVASRQVLSTHGIPLVGEAVGGDYGRTVRLDCVGTAGSRSGRWPMASDTHLRRARSWSWTTAPSSGGC